MKPPTESQYGYSSIPSAAPNWRKSLPPSALEKVLEIDQQIRLLQRRRMEIRKEAVGFPRRPDARASILKAQLSRKSGGHDNGDR